ncbi:hypothetical protein Ga0123461_2312 [Mariprofundus aestuarium]|uniref:Antibiotic biosynthesis monooxygenase n=1 Tax=Mariprofundus aestuarium TaxID=1921086 RepID=A0A2K8L0G6_MARES|nr:hypothetical protein [Mariprofundus aestuarium]ATX80713.1 hypothetical protein Ga0123461_2312 [Mariprofundus aestuarium]
MNKPVTVIAPILLAEGKTESELMQASELFQKAFVDSHPGILRREMVRKSESEYLDIIQFRSNEDLEDVVEKEKGCPEAGAFFALMDMEQMDESCIRPLASLATYNRG